MSHSEEEQNSTLGKHNQCISSWSHDHANHPVEGRHGKGEERSPGERMKGIQPNIRKVLQHNRHLPLVSQPQPSLSCPTHFHLASTIVVLPHSASAISFCWGPLHLCHEYQHPHRGGMSVQLVVCAVANSCPYS